MDDNSDTSLKWSVRNREPAACATGSFFYVRRSLLVKLAYIT